MFGKRKIGELAQILSKNISDFPERWAVVEAEDKTLWTDGYTIIKKLGNAYTVDAVDNGQFIVNIYQLTPTEVKHLLSIFRKVNIEKIGWVEYYRRLALTTESSF